MLPERFSPKSVAVTVLGIPHKPDVAGYRDFLFDAAQVRPELFIGRDPELAVLKSATNAESHLLLDRPGEGDRFHFPAKLSLGFLGQLHPQARGVDAATFDRLQPQQPVTLEFD